MRAPLRVLIAATALATLGTLGLAYGAHAAPPEIDQRKIDQLKPNQHGYDYAWRGNAGHGPQLDCHSAGSLTPSQPSSSPAASTPAGGGRLDLVRSGRCSACSPRWPGAEPG